MRRSSVTAIASHHDKSSYYCPASIAPTRTTHFLRYRGRESIDVHDQGAELIPWARPFVKARPIGTTRGRARATYNNIHSSFFKRLFLISPNYCTYIHPYLTSTLFVGPWEGESRCSSYLLSVMYRHKQGGIHGAVQ